MRIVHAAVAGLLALATGPSVATYTTARAIRDSPRTTGALATDSAGARATSDVGATRDPRATRDGRAPATRGTGVRATRNAMAARSTGRLRGVLGTMRDLPEGFFSHARAPWRAPFRPRASACRALFDAAAGRPPRDGLGGAAAVTAATYDGPHLGELVGVGLAVYDGNEAAQHLDVLRAALIRCATADAGTPYDRLKASPVPLPGIGGPDAAARGLTGRAGGYPYRMHLVVARSGHTLITLVHAGLTPPDPARTAELARLLVREVGTLDG